MALAPLLLRPQESAVLLDFDGTLAPIVVDPARARPLAGVLPALGRLVARYREVAVISGRPASFLAEHLDVEGLVRWGSYGLEQVDPDGSVREDPQATAWRPRVAEVVEAARSSAPAGVGVEDKGVSVTLHVRGAPEAQEWVSGFARGQAARTGLAVHDAKMSVELRPPVAVDKGTVVRRLLEPRMTAACFVGDDLGDVAAFRALAAVAHPVRVAVRSAETPAALLDEADVVVEGPEGALDVLTQLAD